MLKIGSLELASPVMLAPMCGVCDYPYIRLLRRYDPESLAFHEMFSAMGVVHSERRQDDRRRKVPPELQPLGLQLFGHDPAVMAEAALRLEAWGAAVIDLNLGCPVPRITEGCDGSALLREPALLARILAAMARALDGRVPLTIKMRLGYDEAQANYLEVARLAEACGVAAITVHGRTRAQLYSGRANWEAIAEVARAVRIPVIGNGDVADPLVAAARIRESGVAGVMVGRGAQGNPWLFAQIRRYLRTGELLPSPDLATRLRVGLEHGEMMWAERGSAAFADMRRHMVWYTRGAPSGAALRAALHAARSASELRDQVDRYLERLEPDRLLPPVLPDI